MENEDNARTTAAQGMEDLIVINPESFCQTSLPTGGIDAV